MDNSQQYVLGQPSPYSEPLMMVSYRPHEASLSIILSGTIRITIKADGNIEYSNNYTPTEAAKLFWKAIAELHPVFRCKHCQNELGGHNG